MNQAELSRVPESAFDLPALAGDQPPIEEPQKPGRSPPEQPPRKKPKPPEAPPEQEAPKRPPPEVPGGGVAPDGPSA